MVSVRAGKVNDVLKSLNLSTEHTRLLSDNSFNSSAKAPYHKDEHLFTVTLNCYQASLFYKLNEDSQQALILAALYHDVNHTAGKHQDWVNILYAISGAVDLIPLQEKTMPAGTLRKITNLIKSTQYPSIHKPQNILECILRDSDILQTTEPDEEEFIKGLNEENGTHITVSSSREFLSQHHMFTAWGEKRKQQYLTANKNGAC